MTGALAVMRRALAARVPLWMAFGFMAVGAFYGGWMQAMGFADHLGTSLNWRQHVVFATPVALTLGGLWVATAIARRRAVAGGSATSSGARGDAP